MIVWQIAVLYTKLFSSGILECIIQNGQGWKCNARNRHIAILPTFDTLIQRSGHYNAWKVSTWSSSGPYWNATANEQNEC